MEYGQCSVAIAPGRAEASDKSEIITQLLFGETFTIIENTIKWALVRCTHDGYECWMDKKQMIEFNQSEYKKIISSSDFRCGARVVYPENAPHYLTYGAVLPILKGKKYRFDGEQFGYDDEIVFTAGKPDCDSLIQSAMIYLNAPYLWGGRSPFGIDCSGFTQMVFLMAGENLPRDAYQQAEIGETVDFISEAKPGDLAFFDNDEGKIIHVGIVLEDNKIIHASGKVRIDDIDHNGIFHSEEKFYSHQLRIIKRVIQF